MRQPIYWLTRPLIGLYGRLLHLNVHRHNELPRGPKIIVANHPSTTDPFLVALVTGQPARMLIIDHVFDVPLFGTYLRGAGHIPVVPGNGREAFDTATRHVRDGGTLIIFPEGTLSPRKGGFHQPHTGAARLALTTGAPIIPMGISLSPKGLWHIESAIGDRWVASRWVLKGPYGITVGQPLYFTGECEDRAYVRATARQIMQHIMDLANESQERLEAPYLWPSLLEPLAPI
ncbi:MAG: lysophospholipid acyltransferase family protein [Anaerolineae bacterium]